MSQCHFCHTVHQHPFLHCPNCGVQLAHVSVIDGRAIEFSWEDASRRFRLNVAGVGLDRVERPKLTSKGLEFYDDHGTKWVIPGLLLYRQVLQPEREVLEA